MNKAERGVLWSLSSNRSNYVTRLRIEGLALCMAVVCAAGAGAWEYKKYTYKGTTIDALVQYRCETADINTAAGVIKQEIDDLVNSQQMLHATMVNISQLSEAEVYTIWQALGEFSYKEGELYIVRMEDVPNYKFHSSVWVWLTDGGKNFQWAGVREWFGIR